MCIVPYAHSATSTSKSSVVQKSMALSVFTLIFFFLTDCKAFPEAWTSHDGSVFNFDSLYGTQLSLTMSAPRGALFQIGFGKAVACGESTGKSTEHMHDMT